MRERDSEFFRLKGAMLDLIERCGGQRRAGDLVGLSQQMMSCISRRDHTSLLSIRAKLALERDCGVPIVTQVEAELLGCRLETPPASGAAGDGSPLDAHAALMAEVGDLCRCFAQAVGDGRYSHTDAATVSRELADLRRSIERFERVNAATLASLPAAPS